MQSVSPYVGILFHCYSPPYRHVTHGDAATVRKAQGVTVDRAQVLVARNMGRHGVYVALTRQRESVIFHSSEESLKSRKVLLRCNGREGIKQASIDYTHGERGGQVERCGRLTEIKGAISQVQDRPIQLRLLVESEQGVS